MSRFSSLANYIRQHSKKLGASPRIGIDIPGLSKAFSVGKEFSSDTTTFTDELSGIPTITRSIPRLGGLSKVSSLSFTVNNQDLFSDLFASGGSPDPENEAVNVYLYYDDGTAILDAEREKLFSGIISDFPAIDYNKVTFKVDSQDHIQRRKIGTFLTDSDAADTDEGLPELGRGKIKPIVYGDHTFLKANDAKSIDTVSNLNNMTPCVYLGIDSDGKQRWLIAGHKVDEIDVDASTALQGQLWGLDLTTRRFVRLYNDGTPEVTVEQNDSNGCIISIVTEPRFIDYWYGKGTVTKDNNGVTTAFTNEERAIDKDFSTKTTGSVDDGSSTNDYVKLFIPFVDWDNSIDDSRINTVDLVWYGLITYAGGANNTHFSIFIEGTNQTIGEEPEGGNYPEKRVTATLTAFPATQAGILEDMEIALARDDSGPDTKSASLDIYQVYKQITYTPEEITPLYFAGKGRRYGDWINSRTGTEAHADNDGYAVKSSNTDGVTLGATFSSAGSNFVTDGVVVGDTLNITSGGGGNIGVYDVITAGATLTVDRTFNSDVGSQTFTVNKSTIIEKGAGVIESLFRDELSIATADIKEDSLNVASNDLSTTKLSFAIVEQIESDKLFNNILKTLGSIVTYDSDDKIKMRTFVAGDGFGVSGTNSPAPEDIWEFDPHTYFLLESGVNNGLKYKDSNVDTYNVTVTAGSYTGDELATELETQMDAVSTPNMTVSYNSSTGIFTIADAGGNFELLWAHASTTIGEMLGFDVSASDTGAASYTSDFPVWVDSFIEHPLAQKGGFSLRKSTDPIITDLTVNYYRSPTGDYQAISNDTDNTKHAETIKKVIVNDYTKDQTTVEFHRDFILDRSFKKFYHSPLKGMDADLSGMGVEGWDFINVRHPVLNGILESGEETQKWLLLKEQISLKNLVMSIEAEEA